MAMKKSPGPSKPADLLRKSTPPVASGSRRKSAEPTGAATSAKSSPDETDACTCGAEVGKQLERLEASSGAPAKETKASTEVYEERKQG